MPTDEERQAEIERRAQERAKREQMMAERRARESQGSSSQSPMNDRRGMDRPTDRSYSDRSRREPPSDSTAIQPFEAETSRSNRTQEASFSAQSRNDNIDDTLIDIEEKPKKRKKEKNIDGLTEVENPKGFLDYNVSWILLFVYLAYLLGMFFFQQSASGHVLPSFQGVPFYLFGALVGFLLTFILYNFGKFFFAKLTGYEVLFFKFLGVYGYRINGKLQVKFSFKYFLEFRMQFVPVNDDVEKNPTMIFAGGLIVEAIFAIICLILFFTLGLLNDGNSLATLGWTALFMLLYGFVIPLYELMPFKQDLPNDMYNLINTKNPLDKKAFNIYQINKKKEFFCDQYLTVDFEDYNSYYRAKCLIGNYYDDLYASRLEKAFNVLEMMRYNHKFFDAEDSYLYSREIIFLKYFINDEQGADTYCMTLSKDDRRNILNPSYLSDYRTGILLQGFAVGEPEKVLSMLYSFNELFTRFSQEPSNRLLKEREMVDAAYEKVRQARPLYNLPSFDVNAMQQNTGAMRLPSSGAAPQGTPRPAGSAPQTPPVAPTLNQANLLGSGAPSMPQANGKVMTREERERARALKEKEDAERREQSRREKDAENQRRAQEVQERKEADRMERERREQARNQQRDMGRSQPSDRRPMDDRSQRDSQRPSSQPSQSAPSREDRQRQEQERRAREQERLQRERNQKQGVSDSTAVATPGQIDRAERERREREERARRERAERDRR